MPATKTYRGGRDLMSPVMKLGSTPMRGAPGSKETFKSVEAGGKKKAPTSVKVKKVK